MIRVLFVCLGNICRSPALEGAMVHELKKLGREGELIVDSCGLDGWFVGHDPDDRMKEAAKLYDISLSHKARLFRPKDFEDFDYILAVNKKIFETLGHLTKVEAFKKKLFLATHFSPHYKDQDIPDPYYGKATGFEEVMHIATDVAEGLANFIFKG